MLFLIKDNLCMSRLLQTKQIELSKLRLGLIMMESVQDTHTYFNEEIRETLDTRAE